MKRLKSSDLCGICREIRWNSEVFGNLFGFGNNDRTVGQIIDKAYGDLLATYVYNGVQGVLRKSGRKIDTCDCLMKLGLAQH